MLTLKVAFAWAVWWRRRHHLSDLGVSRSALYEREKRLMVPALAVGVVLFLAGAIACYEWLLPAALKVLLGSNAPT